jgi:hypothetical protein
VTAVSAKRHLFYEKPLILKRDFMKKIIECVIWENGEEPKDGIELGRFKSRILERLNQLEPEQKDPESVLAENENWKQCVYTVAVRKKIATWKSLR